MVTDLIIKYNDDKGFYCDDFSHQLFFVVLANLIEKYELKTSIVTISEIEMYFNVKKENKDRFNIELKQEDDRPWIFG